MRVAEEREKRERETTRESDETSNSTCDDIRQGMVDLGRIVVSFQCQVSSAHSFTL